MIKQEMTIGPKGQVVIPQLIRESAGFSPGSTVIVELRGGRVLIERRSKLSKKELERQMKEYYSKYADIERETMEDWKYVDSETAEMIPEW